MAGKFDKFLKKWREADDGGSGGNTSAAETEFTPTDEILSDDVQSAIVEVERAKLAKHSSYRGARPLMSIRFDDGTASQINWLPYLEAYGIKGSICVVTSWMGTPAHLTWNQVRQLRDAGWEIMSHGYTHDSWNSMTPAQIDDECRLSKEQLIAEGIDVKNIVPPGWSGQSPIGRRITRKYYRSSHVGSSVAMNNGVNPPVIDNYNFCAIRGDVGGPYQLNTPEGIVQAKAEVDKAVAGNRYLILFMHDYNVSFAAGMTEVLNYAIAQGVEFATVDEALDEVEGFTSQGVDFSVNEQGVRINEAYGLGLNLNLVNTGVGIHAGRNNWGTGNVYLGVGAGEATDLTTTPNKVNNNSVFIGQNAGDGNVNCNAVVVIGAEAGKGIKHVGATFVGYRAGRNINANATASTAFGFEALDSASGLGAMGIGYNAGKSQTGTRGHFFGYMAGSGNTGHGALGIGYEMCKSNTLAHRVMIGSTYSNATTAWIEGYMDTGAIILGAPTTAVADARIPAGRFSFYLDEGNNKLHFKVKYNDGTTIKTGEVALS